MTTLIDRLVGIEPGSKLDTSFAARSEARTQAELSYQLLLHPVDAGAVSLLERHAIAAFVAMLHDQPETRDHYRALLERSDADGIAAVVLREVEAARASGPYGHFPKGPLSVEDRTGLIYRVPSQARAVLGDRLSAALEQGHLLVLHPRDASQAGLQSLLDAGWTTTGIVVLSQLVAFLSFQIRVVSGLRAFAAAHASTAIPA
ncbi:MAG: CMD domain protein [Pseudomonadota bacterium]